MIKKVLLLIPLLALGSCTNGSLDSTNVAKKGTKSEIVYQNVQYSFNENRYFDVYTNDNKQYKVEMCDVHYIYLDYYLKTDKGEVLMSEFYVKVNKLYIFHKK